MRKKVTIFGKELFLEGEGHFFDGLPDGGDYFESNMAVLRHFTLPGGRVYDIGANIGLMSLAVADLAGQVIAVEADIGNYKHLARNVQACGNVVALNALIGNDREAKTFLSNTLDPSGSTSVIPGQEPAGHDYLSKVAVEARGLDQIVETYGKPDLIKIDVEGSELQVLNSAAKTLARFRPTCLIEFNSLCLMNFGRVNPVEALEQIRRIFPHVCVVLGKQFFPIADNYAFISNNVLTHGAVNDLICSFEPLPLTI